MEAVDVADGVLVVEEEVAAEAGANMKVELSTTCSSRTGLYQEPFLILPSKCNLNSRVILDILLPQQEHQ